MEYSLAYCGSWASIIGGIWLLFHIAEETISPEAKAALTEALYKESTNNWLGKVSSYFVQLFDGVFGVKHFTWRCFLKSSAFSVLAVFFMAFLWMAFRPEEFELYVNYQASLVEFLLIVLIGACFNVVFDYLSLLQTRKVIGYAKESSGLFRSIVHLCLDLLLTFLVALVMLSTFAVFDERSVPEFELYVTSFSLSSNGVGAVSGGIWFWSTFFTSVWLWIYLLATILIKVDSTRVAMENVFRASFDLVRKPIKSVGFVAVLTITVVFVAYPIVCKIFV